MTIHTGAIYEGGLLRPLVPLSLKEQEVVSLTISTGVAESRTDAEVARQRSVLTAYIAKVESRPVVLPSDGLSNRDHDRLIYGK